jgi:hypothetical protein
MKPVPSLLLVLLVLGGLSGCDYAVLGPEPAVVATIRVRVTGGIASADYTYEVSTEGHVTGVDCINLCSFVPGDTLTHMTAAQQEAVLEAVNRSGLPTSGRPVDFGTECCDQFTYRVTYASGLEIRTFAGGFDQFPEPLQVLVRTLNLLYQGTGPLIVAQDSGLGGFPGDPLELLDARIDGGTLALDVRYAGGCTDHDLDAVAWTGWMESNPVQVGIAVAHGSRGDSCKALVARTVRFDLEPLRRAYESAYGSGPGTLVLRVGVAGQGSARSLDFVF